MGNPGRDKEKQAAEKRRRRFWDFAQLLVGPWARWKFGYSFEDFEPADIEGPVLVAINHACAYDPIFVGVAFRNKPLTFIASEHILRSKWGPFLDKYISFIPHQKGARGSRTALVTLKRIKKGESVFLAVEGGQTWDGRPLPVMPYTGKLIRGSGATLVTYLIEGAYLSAPNWATSTRKGRVYGRPAGVYSPEELQQMSDEEVEDLLAKDLNFDVWEWQITLPEGPVRYKCAKGGNAEGLESAVFTCPCCGAIGTLKSHGNSIGCSCGFKARMSDTGFFEDDAPFETIAEWEDFDKESLMAVIKEASAADRETEILSDDGVTLIRIKNEHNEENAARGKLSLCCSKGTHVLSIGDFRFDLSSLSDMKTVRANRIVFSDESGYYELRSGKGSNTNLRKYVIARDLLKE